MRQQRRTAGGQGDRAAVAVEQADLQVAFERLDLLGQRRTRDVQPFGRATEVQLLGDGHEVAQLAQLHPASVVQCEAAPINREQTGHTGGAWSGAEPALQRASTRGRDQTMNNSQRVAIITGASQGIGEGLVTAYRKLGYAVVANSRTIAESDDPMVRDGARRHRPAGRRAAHRRRGDASDSAGSTPWSTTPASSLPSRSPTTPTTTTTPSPE